MFRRFTPWLALGGVLVCASAAWANPGAAGLAVGIHVMFWCFFIGIGESLVAMAFGARWWSLLLILLANYLSAILGVAIASSVFEALLAGLDEEPLKAVIPASWLAFALFILLGAVIEAPFFLASYSHPIRQWRRALAAVLVGTMLSNAMLAAWYSLSWADSLVSSLAFVDSPAEIAAELEHDTPWVYFIQGDTVKRIRLDGSDIEIVRAARGSLADAELIATSSGDDLHLIVNEIDIAWAQPVPGLRPDQPVPFDRSSEMFVTVAANVGGAASMYEGYPWAAHGPRTMAYRVADLRPASERVTMIDSSWDGSVGITVSGDEQRSLALDNGFIQRSLTPFSVTVLPGEILVFELNHEYEDRSRGVYIVSLRTNRIARLADGRSPVVVFEQPIPGWAPPDTPGDS